MIPKDQKNKTTQWFSAGNILKPPHKHFSLWAAALNATYQIATSSLSVMLFFRLKLIIPRFDLIKHLEALVQNQCNYLIFIL